MDKVERYHQLKDLSVAGSATGEIPVHTDSPGDANANMGLSEQRSFAVKKWLEQQSSL